MKQNLNLPLTVVSARSIRDSRDQIILVGNIISGNDLTPEQRVMLLEDVTEYLNKKYGNTEEDSKT